MANTPICIKCGVLLAVGAVEGLCPACLLQDGLDVLAATVKLSPEALPTTSSVGPTSSPTESPRTTIGPYKLLQQLGEGGMGNVWMAEQTEPVRRVVAIKVIKPGMDSAGVLARFEVERQALALMEHPNIARVFDAGTTPAGRPYFVMELVKGVPITEYCDEQRLSIPERLELFETVCHAIQHAHQKGVIHRDIKPSNVLVALLDGKPVAKVIDFGIAKATGRQLTDKTLFTEVGSFLGTLEYMSPEQAQANQFDIDTRSDIYGLGVLLYQLLTGSTPLTHATVRRAALDEVLQRVRQEDPPKPSTRLSDSRETLAVLSAQRKIEPPKLIASVRGDLDWIVMKALEKDRNRRYETANGLAMDLQRHLRNEPVLAGPPTARYRVKKFVRKHRAAVAAAAGFVLMLTAATAVSAILAQKAKKAEREAWSLLGFLRENVLAAARPEGLEGGLGYDVTLREALHKAEPAIARAFANQPLAEASLRDDLALSYQLLGEYTNAVAQNEIALALRKRHLGPQRLETLISMNKLAVAYRYIGQPTKALELQLETLRLMQAALGPDHTNTLHCMNNLALAYKAAGYTNEAVTWHERTLQLRTARLGPDDLDTLQSMHNLVTAYRDARRPTNLVGLCEVVLQKRQAKLPPGHRDTLTSMNSLATALRDEGRLTNAIDLRQKTLGLMTTKVGPVHRETLQVMYNLAVDYRRAGRLNEAAEWYRKTLQLRMDTFGPDHADTRQSVKGMVDLARVCSASNRLDEAESVLRDALVALRRALSVDNSTLVDALDLLGSSCLAQNNYDAAVEPLHECVDIYERQNPNDWTHFKVKTRLGAALLGRKEYAKAERQLSQGFDGLKQRQSDIPGSAERYLRYAAKKLADLYAEIGKHELAMAWREKFK